LAEQQRVKVALCIPTLGPPTWQLFDSFGRWQAYHFSHETEAAVTVIRPPRPLPVDMARSYLASKVLEGDYDYLWFTDQDAAYHHTTLDRLMAWDVPVVGVLCMMRASTWCMPMVFKGQNENDPEFYHISIDETYNYLRDHANVETNEPQVIDPIPEGSLYGPVDFTGCHCLLIKREVLEAMEPPWFSGQPGQEDRYFCFKAKEAGFPVYVDFSTIAGHATGERLIGVYDYMAHYLYQGVLEGAYDVVPVEGVGVNGSEKQSAG
jgi:hypothetical protein